MNPNSRTQLGLKPTADQITAAVEELGICKYFPSGEGERKAIMRLIRAMVNTKQQLDWLVSVMVNKIGEWRGPVELRGVFCSRFRPADGAEADCAATPGFTPDELEARTIVSHQDLKALAGGQDRKLIAAALSPVSNESDQVSAPTPTPKPISTTSVRRRTAPEDVKRVDELLRRLEGL